MTPGLELSPLVRQMLLGACAGVAGTVAMTAVMRRLHERLSPSQRYPLPPRELTDRIVPRAVKSGDEAAREQWTTLAHFGYGAAVGAFFPLVARCSGMAAGSLYGVDPLDQPGVELSKRLTYGLLGREGFQPPELGTGEHPWRV